ncbi:MAG: class I SAM-dependent methyltransferase [Planctomycetota bacterium]|jgi:SAM-dependent methyltransferase
MDERQAKFAEFEVPDPGRIRKVHDWLTANGHLDTRERPVSVLEIGYARGGLIDYLDAGGDFRKFAVDLHERKASPGVTFFQHDCNENFDFAEGMAFDVVFAGEVIEHMYDDRHFLEEIHRILAPRGVVALTTPNLFFFVNRIVMPFGRMPYFAYMPYHYHYYSRPILTRLADECGFDVRRVTSSHVLVSTRRHKVVGGLCERLGDLFPSFGAHLILFATKREANP